MIKKKIQKKISKKSENSTLPELDISLKDFLIDTGFFFIWLKGHYKFKDHEIKTFMRILNVLRLLTDQKENNKMSAGVRKRSTKK